MHVMHHFRVLDSNNGIIHSVNVAGDSHVLSLSLHDAASVHSDVKVPGNEQN